MYDATIKVSDSPLTRVAVPGSELHEQHVVRGALPRDVQAVRVDVGRVGVLHVVPFPARIGPLEVVCVRQLVRLAGFHADRGPRNLNPNQMYMYHAEVGWKSRSRRGNDPRGSLIHHTLRCGAKTTKQANERPLALDRLPYGVYLLGGRVYLSFATRVVF